MAEKPEKDASVVDREETPGVERKTMLKPPNKKKYDEELEAINAQIQQSTEDRVKLQASYSGEHIAEELQLIRSWKDDMFNKRKLIDRGLQKVNGEIVKQNSEITRVESTLRFKSEERTNQTITRLEHQLKLRNFPLREERRIVNEVDALKRSKKALDQYMGMKREIDGLKEQARRMREEREDCHKECTKQKQKEEKLKHQVHTDKIKVAKIKQEEGELYEKRRTLQTNHRAQEREYLLLKRQKQEEMRNKLQEKKLLDQEAYEKELAEYESTHTLYQEEIQLCRTLLAYLQRFGSEPEHSSQKSPEHMSELPCQEGMYVLKKKNDEELFGGVVRQKGKRNKRDKRRTLSNKPINHTPEIFEQFSSLKLMAPSITTEVPHAIQQLEMTKQEFEELSKPTRSLSSSWNVENYFQSLPQAQSLPSPTDTQLKLYMSLPHADLVVKDCPKVVPSHAESMSSRIEVSSIGPESAICEDSIPSTPEVQNDNQPPQFLPSTSPTLSLDSGTVSLDNGIENLKRSTSPTTSDHSTLIPDECPSSRSDSIEDARTDGLEHESSLESTDQTKGHDNDPSDKEVFHNAKALTDNFTAAINPCSESLSLPPGGSSSMCAADEAQQS